MQVRHEEAAAFMACAYAKWTGRLGVCIATSGPGGIHLLNGLYDAKLDGQPVIAITGLQHHDLLHTYTQQDVELDKLFMDVCVYNGRVMGPAHTQNVVELACRTALAYRGVAHVTMPVDTQSEKVSSDHRSERNIPDHVSDLMAESAHMPTENQTRARRRDPERGQEDRRHGRARRAERPRRGRGDRRAARRAGGRSRCSAKACCPTTIPYTTGGIGLLGTAPSQDALESCDTLLIVGSSFPYIEFYPKPGQAKSVQIELDPKRVGLRCPVDVALVGDSARVLRALLPRLDHHQDRSFLETGPGRHAGLARTDAGARHPDRHADEAAGGGARAEQALVGRRDRRHRLRHDHDLGGAPHRHARQHDVLVLGQPRHHGVRAALRQRGRRSPIRAGRWSPSSATAGSPC